MAGFYPNTWEQHNIEFAKDIFHGDKSHVIAFTGHQGPHTFDRATHGDWRAIFNFRQLVRGIGQTVVDVFHEAT